MLCGESLSVHVQRNLGQIGINLNSGCFSGSLCVTSAAEIDERFPAPIGLVQIKGFLLYFPVHGDKSLVVASGSSTLVSGGAAEVKHVPDMSSPEVGAFHENFSHVFVVLCLIAFRIVPAFRFIRLVGDNTFRTVLRESKAYVGMLFMKLVQPLFVVLVASSVPAEIVVVAFHIGDSVKCAVHGKHTYMSDSSESAGVYLFNKGI